MSTQHRYKTELGTEQNYEITVKEVNVSLKLPEFTATKVTESYTYQQEKPAFWRARKSYTKKQINTSSFSLKT